MPVIEPELADAMPGKARHAPTTPAKIQILIDDFSLTRSIPLVEQVRYIAQESQEIEMRPTCLVLRMGTELTDVRTRTDKRNLRESLATGPLPPGCYGVGRVSPNGSIRTATPNAWASGVTLGPDGQAS